MIWDASMSSRIVSFYSREQRHRQCTRIWSNKTTDDESFFWSRDAIERFNCLSYHDITDKQRFEARHGPTRGFIRKYQSTLPPPATLYACQESRAIALRRYERQFGTVQAPPTTWIDFENDTLFLGWDSYLGRIGDVGQKVRHLAVVNREAGFKNYWGNSTYGNDHAVEYWFAALFVEFPNLETLTLVMQDNHSWPNQDFVFSGPVEKEKAVVKVGSRLKKPYDVDLMGALRVIWFKHVDRNQLRAIVGSDRYKWIRSRWEVDQRPVYNLPKTVSFVQRRSN